MRTLARPLMYAGVASIVFGLAKYHAEFIGRYDLTDSYRFSWAFAYIGLQCIAAYGFGLPDGTPGDRRVPSALLASGTGAAGISATQLIVGDTLLPRFVVFGAAVILVPWYWAMSVMASAGRRTSERRDRVVVVGPPRLSAELASELAASPERPASVVATLTEHEAANVSDRRRPVVERVVAESATVIVLSAAAQADDRIIGQAAALHESGVRVRTQSLFFEEWLGKIPVADLGRVSLFFDIGEIHRERYGRAKRLVDLVAGVSGLAVLVVVVPFVLVGNAVGNRGPLFYTQDRVGRGGRPFRIVKFRSMVDRPLAATDWTSEDDPRITSFGRLLRRSHLDELPQMWNIAKGDLSLVGPRPEQPRYVTELVEKLPFYDLRHMVRPGLTGWAQVKYGYAGDERDALEKLQYDFHYLRRQSLVFDLRIVGRTIRSVLGRAGR